MRYVILILLCLLFTSCGLLSFDQQRSALAVVDELVYNGTISYEQGEAMRQAITAHGQWWIHAVNIVGGAVLAWLGIRTKLPGIGRGAPTQVVGLPADLVKSSE